MTHTKAIVLISSLLLLQAVTLKSQILQTDLISSDTTWSSDTIKIYNDIVVEYPATLTIEPGVYVEFQGNYSLSVYGGIKAIGTVTDSIFFTVADTNYFADTATLAGGWGSIKLLDNPTDTSEFSYCKFSYGKAIDPGHTINDHLNEENWGGALFVKNYGNVFCTNSCFYNNRANFAGGAIWVKYCLGLKLINNSFIKNQAFQQGGGASIGSCSTAIISNNLFKLNKAFVTFQTNWGWRVQGTGGGLRVNVNCNADILNNKFYNNHAVGGGGFYETTSNCLVSGNIVANNKGTGIMNGHGNSISTYTNNTIVNNLAYDPNGCGIICNRGLKMRNNIIWGNDKVSGWPTYEAIQVYSFGAVMYDFTHSCVQDDYPGVGNIQDDPLFVNPTAGAGLDYDGLAADWSLLDSSPCVNTGTPDTTGLNLPATDLLGNPRVYGIRIDMGAIENQMVVGLPQNPLVNARLQVSPNPFGQSFKVVAPGRDKISSISLFNQNGQQIATETMMPFEQMLVFDLRNQSPGLYLLVTRFADGSTETTKLVKY